MIAEFMYQTMRFFELQKKYENAIQYDQKTGLLNYQSYLQYFAQMEEEKYSTFGIWAIHIADLKNYNKIYGTKTGDELLKSVGDIMVGTFGEDSVFRISGARFFAICPNIIYENFQRRCEMAQKSLEELQPEMFVSAKADRKSVV